MRNAVEKAYPPPNSSFIGNQHGHAYGVVVPCGNNRRVHLRGPLNELHNVQRNPSTTGDTCDENPKRVRRDGPNLKKAKGHDAGETFTQ